MEIIVYFIPADIGLSASDVEERYIEIVRSVRETVNIPIAMKLNPYFSSIGNMSKRLCDAEVDGLVLFNRFYQPDFEIS